MTGPILMCRYCGADSPRKCDFGDNADVDHGEDHYCPWSESGEYEEERGAIFVGMLLQTPVPK